MKLDFIYSEKLLPWIKEKHIGMFVYLTNDYMDENSEVMYKYGLYFGGMFGWERVTNDFFEREIVDIPVSSKIIYYYNGKNQNYYPDNWDNISGDCVPTNNIQKNAGTYIVGFGLEDQINFQWSDESINDKTLVWNILPYNVSVDKISVELNKYEMTYGDYEPYVVSVIAEVFDEEGNLVVRNLEEDEYEVTKPLDFNVGDKNFIIKLKGNYNSDNVIKTVTVNPHAIYYYGMADQNIETNYVSGDVFTLPAGYKEAAESEFTITNANTFDSSLYSKCRSWYVAVPAGTNVLFVEGGIHIVIKKKSYIYTDELGNEYDVYLEVIGGVYNNTLNVTIK